MVRFVATINEVESIKDVPPIVHCLNILRPVSFCFDAQQSLEVSAKVSQVNLSVHDYLVFDVMGCPLLISISIALG